MLGEELLSLIFEKVHYFLECPARLPNSRGARPYRKLGKEICAATQRRSLRELRLLRNPDRLGVGGLRRVPKGGRPRRLHHRPRRAPPAVPRHPARDPERFPR